MTSLPLPGTLLEKQVALKENHATDGQAAIVSTSNLWSQLEDISPCQLSLNTVTSPSASPGTRYFER